MAKTIFQAPNATMGAASQNAGTVASNPQFCSAKSEAKCSTTPLVGFLYSVSRTAMGEFWPIYGGNNTIGRVENSVVKLNDPEVSENHASLVVQNRMEAGKKVGVTVYLRDNASIHGTMLNGNSVQLDPLVCKHGDIITVGQNYELYLILVDADELGLKQSEALKNVPQEAPAPAQGWQPNQPAMFAGSNPKGTVVQAPQGGANPLSASSTIYMPKK